MLTRNYFGADAMHSTKKRLVAKRISVMVVRCTNCCNVRAAYLEAVSDLFSASVAMIIYDQATLCSHVSENSITLIRAKYRGSTAAFSSYSGLRAPSMST